MVRNREMQTSRGSAPQAEQGHSWHIQEQLRRSVAGVEGWKERGIGSELIKYSEARLCTASSAIVRTSAFALMACQATE